MQNAFYTLSTVSSSHMTFNTYIYMYRLLTAYCRSTLNCILIELSQKLDIERFSHRNLSLLYAMYFSKVQYSSTVRELRKKLCITNI